MCRLAAFPPGFPKAAAIEIMSDMLHNNDDGVGVSYLKGDQFMPIKAPVSLTEALRGRLPLFDHMPYKSWTIAHIRQKTHGDATIVNTHPFIKGKYCVVHNGVYSDHDLVRISLTGTVQFKGDTDSETAAYLIRKLGPRDFAKYISSGGVYLALERNGKLHVVNTEGEVRFAQIQLNKKPGGYVISSEFHGKYSKPSKRFQRGYFLFDELGNLSDGEEIKWKEYWRSRSPSKLSLITESRADSKAKSYSSNFIQRNGLFVPPYQHEVGRHEEPKPVQSPTSNEPESRSDTGHGISGGSGIAFNADLWKRHEDGSFHDGEYPAD